MLVASVAALSLFTGGCVQQAAPDPAVIRDTAPPWPAPRDAISHIREAGVPELPQDDRSDPWTLTITVAIDGTPVEVPAYIGVDRPRAVQAPLHTHDDTGTVWLEGRGNRDVTLADFFVLWGVRFSDTCLGNACGRVRVTADGKPLTGPAASTVLRGIGRLDVAVASQP